jgi:DNA-directed RNA polymerase subunit RPC12/RpoP
MNQEDQSAFRCWKCGNEIHVVRAQAGAKVECPYCQSPATVPEQLFGPPVARTIGPTSSTVQQKSPATAAVLNFLFWGAGYVYAGRAWGWAVLIPYILLTLIGLASGSQCSTADVLIATLLTLPIDFALGWHAYQIVKEGH